MTTKRSIELTAGESCLIGGAKVTLLEKSGKRARIVVRAPSDLPIVHPITDSNHSAHECASSPEVGKEQAHGQHPV
ncbi:hypothetical protein ACFIQF_22650 [Comamonas sp. J-3]|uniref:hypothetical protein n=1 Tax=Comamonas trifloxystrobinivorans TaxID=3350256 RepID=UPI00372A2654